MSLFAARPDSRRAWMRRLAGGVLGERAAAHLRAEEIAPAKVAELLGLNELDREIWAEELEAFVPRRVYDMHSHLWRAEFDHDPVARYNAKRSMVPTAILSRAARYEMLVAADQALMPGREVRRLIFGDPHANTAFVSGNEFIAGECRKDSGSAALMMVHPNMSADAVDRTVRQHRFLGFKPYPFFASSGDIWNARITEFLPEHQLGVANRYGLIIGLHMSKAAAIADRENLDDLERLTAKYPRVRWVLFHNARSYSAWAIERAAPRLRNIPNLWYESSAVCETDAFDGLFSFVDRKRFCYGSDDFPVGVTRGKYVAWGHGWAEINMANQAMSVSHCEGRFTFVRYEMLRAMRRAAKHASLTKTEVEDVFYHNGASLVETVRKDLAREIGS